MTAVSSDQLDPSQIMQLGGGFMGAKTLLSAIELELFTHLASNALTGSQIKDGWVCTRGLSRTSPTHCSRTGC